MKFVKTEDLKIGMRLAKPIYNNKGVLLYDRNSKLTQQGIESVRNFKLIGIYVLEPAEPLPPLSEDDMEFEKLLVELQSVVDKLDQPTTGLDEGIALFNRGIELSKQCMQLLNDSKGKVSLLKKELDTVTAEAFDVDADNN